MNKFLEDPSRTVMTPCMLWVGWWGGMTRWWGGWVVGGLHLLSSLPTQSPVRLQSCSSLRNTSTISTALAKLIKYSDL